MLNHFKTCVAVLIAAIPLVLSCSLFSNNRGITTIKFQGTLPGGTLAVSMKSAWLKDVSPSPLFADVQLVSTGKSGTNSGVFTLTEARMSVKEIKIKLSTEDTKSTEDSTENEKIKLNGPFIADLISNTLTPQPTNLGLKAGTYKQIQFKLDKIEGDEKKESSTSLVTTNDPLYGSSVYLAGFYTGQTANKGIVTNMPFSFTFSLEDELTLTPPGSNAAGFAVSTDADNPIIIAFRMGKWFNFNTKNTDGSDLTVTTVNATDTILLTENGSSGNKTLRDLIKENIKSSANYGKDKDKDGILSDSEDD